MMNYISCELVKAEKISMCRSEVYSIDHSDGTRGHSSVERFEKYFIPVDPNPELTKSEISVSQKMVDEFIAYDEVTTMGEATTVVRCVLRNGFVIVESSSCVDPANYSEEMGAEICRERIKNKIWELLGFLLATAKNGIN